MKKIRNARIMAMVDALHETKAENSKMLELSKKVDLLEKELLDLLNDENKQERIIEIFEEVYNNVCNEFAEDIENAYRIGLSDGLALHKIAV